MFTFFFGAFLKPPSSLFYLNNFLTKEVVRRRFSKAAASVYPPLPLLKVSIEGMRNEESFDRIYDGCVDQMKEFPFVEKLVLKRQRKAPNYSLLQYFEGYNASETRSHHPESPHDHYRVLFYGAVDELVSSVQERFNQPSFLIFEQLESLFIKTLKGEETPGELSSVESN